MGFHRKPSRIRLTHLLPTAAVPALAATAAVICLAPQAMADPTPAHGAAHPASATQAAVTRDTAGYKLAVKAMIARQAVAAAQQATYKVRPGDSLSSIAGRVYHKQGAWPVLYWANRDKIHWANVLSAGQVLKVPALPAKIPAAPSALGPAAPAAPAAPAQATGVLVSTYSGGAPGGSFGACVIARESGGNAQIMNASGHYGLYQFSEATWVAYGGAAADFGHASVAEQNQVFANALARGGQSNWAPYDGC